jgi:hypothetical protein
MSHHGNQPPNLEMHEMMRKLMGEYPNGRLNSNDSGAVAMAVGAEGGRVLLKFPKAVAWVGMTPDEAIGLAETLVKHARTAGATKALSFQIG